MRLRACVHGHVGVCLYECVHTLADCCKCVYVMRVCSSTSPVTCAFASCPLFPSFLTVLPPLHLSPPPQAAALISRLLFSPSSSLHLYSPALPIPACSHHDCLAPPSLSSSPSPSLFRLPSPHQLREGLRPPPHRRCLRCLLSAHPPGSERVSKQSLELCSVA